MVANLIDSIRRALLPHKTHETPRSQRPAPKKNAEANDTLTRTSSPREHGPSGWKFCRDDCAYFDKLMAEALATNSTDKSGVRRMFINAGHVASFLPNYPDAPAVQALSWLYAGDYDRAAEYNRKSLALDPENAIAKRVQEYIDDPLNWTRR